MDAHQGTATQADRDGLAREWRRLGRAATLVAVVTSPATLALFWVVNDLPLWLSVLLTLGFVAAFRGAVDIVCHRLIPRPSLYGADERLKAEDVVFRRRRWYWRTRFRRLLWLALIAAVVTTALNVLMRVFGLSPSWLGTWGELGDQIGSAGPVVLIQMGMLFVQLPLLFLANFLIFFGPLLMFGVMQMKAFEPGDADWGVGLSDVRGQEDSKQEVERVITLWAAGDEFKKAGGKPERGLLLIGAPGTGKTMLSKAIATSFNSPIMTMPGSGFAQTFIGLDVVMVMILIARARRLARKWGGTCMIFIDEIDAVGMRRNALGGVPGGAVAPVGITRSEDVLFFGDWGARTPSGDLRLETPAWRERVFAERAAAERALRDAGAPRVREFMMPGMGGGMALNQLLVQMDGMDNPPLMKKFFTKKWNTFLDALYVVPQRAGSKRLRFKPPAPRSEQVYFIGATNVPLDVLDPALIRPGRMGRHIFFRTPTKDDRADVFDLYLGRVAHVADLDRPERREEIARITGGYSPAMIEQVCSMALTYAHSDGRLQFTWEDLIESMTTIESGTAVGFEYIPDESRSIAIHEAGHAVCSHVYMDGVLSTRLSIRRRGSSGGHHQAIALEERFVNFRHQEVAEIVWGLGALAAEHVFYGENSQGVGGDLHQATTQAALMVGQWGMGAEPTELNGHGPQDPGERARFEHEITQRFQRIGDQLINRTSTSGLEGVLADPQKRRQVAQILGQAYITALCLIRHNKDGVARIADVLVQREEIHGDDVVRLLDSVGLAAPDIDLTDDAIWPKVALVDPSPPWTRAAVLEAPAAERGR